MDEPLDRDRASATESPGGARFPHLRLRTASQNLIELPWETPLDAWTAGQADFRELAVGPSRHLVRFVRDGTRLYALKEEPLEIARREYDVLRHLESLELPAVAATGLAEAPTRGVAVLVTEYLAHSLQYRRLLARLPSGPSPYRGRLLDAMASLLVDLHRGGVYWGDCSLANTLFRRDGDKIQAYLVDAETSEAHPSLSDGQRAYDLEVLVENVAFGLADLAAVDGRIENPDDAVEAAEGVQISYCRLWDELHADVELKANERFAVGARVRRLNELGFAIDELDIEPGAGAGRLRLRVTVATRRFHARELARRTGIVALEGQARLLLNELREYRAWLEWSGGTAVDAQTAARRWRDEVYRPALARIAPRVEPGRDMVQAYCDVLEHKWLLSERAGRDVGLDAAIRSYLELGAPAPEVGTDAAGLSPPTKPAGR